LGHEKWVVFRSFSLPVGLYDQQVTELALTLPIEGVAVGEKNVIQLFNVGPADSHRPFPPGEVAMAAFKSVGLKSEIWPPYHRPWNLLDRMHNAYQGLDPLRALKVLLTARKADLICGHLESTVLVLLLRRLFGFRVPIVIWEVPWSPGWRFREIVSRLALPRADGCVVFSKNQIDLIHKEYGTDVPVYFQHFHTDTDFYSPRTASASAHRIVWSCGLDAGRDFSILLEASKHVDAQFRIKAKNLDAPAEQFPNVSLESRFLPPEEFRQQYADASVVVVCTQNTPNASGVTSLMESLSMGRPTVVSDNPALREYIPTDGALVVPVGDAVALQNAINYLLENPDIAEEMGRKARLFAQQRLSATRHYNDMAKLFLTLVETGKADLVGR
jgi:glycosyltransferase involved in cell wall biosynthesis